MPSPVTPQEFKNLIPSPTGGFCEKFLASLRLGALVYKWFSWMFNEDGTFTDEFKADICALNCSGTGTPTPPGGGGLPIPVLTASDGTFNDKVRLTWTSIPFATSYGVYRNSTNDSGTASLIGSPTTNTYDDTVVTAGTLYYYWVKAINATTSSNLSAVDTGYASLVLSAVGDLVAGQGLNNAVQPVATVQLQWTTVTDATAYDIYRGVTNVFASATPVDMNRVPFDNARSPYPCVPFPCTKPLFVDNGGGILVYHDSPPSQLTKFYYWVVPKKVSGTTIISVGSQSNSAAGWSSGDGTRAVFVSAGTLTANGQEFTFPAGITKCWIVLIGAGAAGAGGGAAFGGGGGGAGATMSGLIDVVAGKKLKLILGTDSVPGASVSNATDGPVTALQYDGTGSFVDMFNSGIADGGEYNPAGGGLGGAGSIDNVDGAVQFSFTKPGTAGLPEAGGKGGRGGFRFGQPRKPANHLNGVPAQTTGEGGSGDGGGGSDPIVSAPGLATGGGTGIGVALFMYYVS